MKVTLVNKSDSTGGAAVACYRLLVALSENNVDVQLLVQEKKKDNEFCISTTQSKFKNYRCVNPSGALKPLDSFLPADYGERYNNP